MLPFLLCIVEFIREEIIAILGMVFISFFNQVAMEVICWHISVFVGPCIPFKNLATMDVYSILFLIEKNGFMCTYVFECITKVVVMFWHILA